MMTKIFITAATSCIFFFLIVSSSASRAESTVDANEDNAEVLDEVSTKDLLAILSQDKSFLPIVSEYLSQDESALPTDIATSHSRSKRSLLLLKKKFLIKKGLKLLALFLLKSKGQMQQQGGYGAPAPSYGPPQYQMMGYPNPIPQDSYQSPQALGAPLG